MRVPRLLTGCLLSGALLGATGPAASAQTGQTPSPGQTPKPGQTLTPGQTTGALGNALGGDSSDLAASLPKVAFNKVFTFRCDDDGYANGRISVTITSIKGLGKSIKDDFNEAVDDQDGVVLVSKNVRVYRKGDRVGRGKLDDAEEIAVKGKLLKPSQWRDDEDGNAIPTIRAKRVTILG